MNPQKMQKTVSIHKLAKNTALIFKCCRIWTVDGRQVIDPTHAFRGGRWGETLRKKPIDINP